MQLLLKTVYYCTIRCVLQDRYKITVLLLFEETPLRLVFAFVGFVYISIRLTRWLERAIVPKISSTDLVKYLNPLLDNELQTWKLFDKYHNFDHSP